MSLQFRATTVGNSDRCVPLSSTGGGPCLWDVTHCMELCVADADWQRQALAGGASYCFGPDARGARLEGALSRFRRLNPFARFLGLSATLGNSQELATWFDGIAYTSTWRPIPMQWRVIRYRKADEKPTLLLEEVRRNTHSGGKS